MTDRPDTDRQPDAPGDSRANPQSAPAAPAEFAAGETSADLTPTLKRLLTGATLTADETTAAFEAIMTGRAHHGEIGALLGLLASRTPTGDEILGAARVMRRHVDAVPTALDPASMLDTAGTGGAPKTFNVSTAAAIIAAGAGASVAKHGNRSRTGRGSAEVLRQLGVNVDADRSTQAACLEDVGVCFCFAIHHHPAAKHAMPVRLALGFPTIFNLLGPLTNPAGAQRQLMGVYHSRFLQPIAEALAELGAMRAMVIHSDDGLDELSLSAPTTIVYVEGGEIREQRVDPASLGLTTAPREAVTARDLSHAAEMIHQVLDNRADAAVRDMALLNAAAAIVAAGVADDFPEALTLAEHAVTSGEAADRLARLAERSHAGGG